MGSWESANPSECAFGVRLLALQGCGIIFGADLCLAPPSFVVKAMRALLRDRPARVRGKHGAS